MRGGIVERSGYAEHRIAHLVDYVVIGDVARPDQLDARGVQAALHILAQKRTGEAARDPNKQGIWLGVARALQMGREFGALQRHPQRLDNLPATRSELADKCLLRFKPRRVVRHQGHGSFYPILDRPLRHQHRYLSVRIERAHDVWRAFRDDRCRGSHDDLGDSRLAGQRRYRERAWGWIIAREDRYLTVDDEV